MNIFKICNSTLVSQYIVHFRGTATDLYLLAYTRIPSDIQIYWRIHLNLGAKYIQNESIWIINMSDSTHFRRSDRKIIFFFATNYFVGNTEGSIETSERMKCSALDAVENSKNAIDIMANWNVFLFLFEMVAKRSVLKQTSSKCAIWTNKYIYTHTYACIYQQL